MENLFKFLSDAQASLFVLFHKTWVYHWNVVGPDFTQLHELFGKQYEEMFEEIDRLSEHMRYLSIKPISNLSRLNEVSHINGGDSFANATSMLEQLLEDNTSLINLFISIVKEAEEQNHPETSNLIQDLMESHGKFVWQLRSHLQ